MVARRAAYVALHLVCLAAGAASAGVLLPGDIVPPIDDPIYNPEVFQDFPVRVWLEPEAPVFQNDGTGGTLYVDVLVSGIYDLTGFDLTTNVAPTGGASGSLSFNTAAAHPDLLSVVNGGGYAWNNLGTTPKPSGGSFAGSITLPVTIPEHPAHPGNTISNIWGDPYYHDGNNLPGYETVNFWTDVLYPELTTPGPDIHQPDPDPFDANFVYGTFPVARFSYDYDGAAEGEFEFNLDLDLVDDVGGATSTVSAFFYGTAIDSLLLPFSVDGGISWLDELEYLDLAGNPGSAVVLIETTVPEPATMLLLASGIAGLAVVRRRRK